MLTALLAITGLALSACTVTTQSQSVTPASNQIEMITENSFIGRVTGYGVDTRSYGGDDEGTVYVDGKRVDLDLIWPYSANCMERELLQDDAFSSARDALEQILPIGQRVLVILSNYENGKWVGDETEGFIHILEDGDVPEVSPPADSVNERLVLTGYWVPHGMGIEFDAYAFNATYGAFNPDYLSQIQEEYLPHIFEAGNKARSQFVGATAICSALALDYEIDDFYISVSYSRDDEENDRLVRIERNKPVYCRDGDGDGICFER
jgi:hypothetical protein